MNVDSSDERRLADLRVLEPAWSLDGTRVAFASWRDGDGEIYVMDAGGSHLQKLTDKGLEHENLVD